MRVIYEPRGRALEYAQLSIRSGPYVRCGHGCSYCFNLGIQGMYADEFAKSAAPVKDFLMKFEKDCKELEIAGDQREILLSFTTDIYQPLNEEYRYARAIIKILMQHGLNFTVLTKGGRRSIVDFDLMAEYKDHCRYGTTLVLRYPEDRRRWEPGAAPTHERISALALAHSKGIRTWVSMEPVIFPDQTLELIVDTLDLVHKKPGIVDEYRIGKFNHSDSPDVQHIIEETGYQYPTNAEWRQFVQDAKALLDEHGARYIFKRDLQPYLRAAGVSS